MSKFNQLYEELAEQGFGLGQLLEGLQAVKANQVKLTHEAHQQFELFMQEGALMFAPREDSNES